MGLGVHGRREGAPGKAADAIVARNMGMCPDDEDDEDLEGEDDYVFGDEQDDYVSLDDEDG